MPIPLQNASPIYLPRSQTISSILGDDGNENPIHIQLRPLEWAIYEGRALYFDENPVLANNGEINYHFAFDATLLGEYMQLFISVVPKFGFEFGLYEEPTGVAGGTPLSFVNLNRNYPDNHFLMTVLKDPTIGNNGTELQYFVNDTEGDKNNDPHLPGYAGDTDWVLNGGRDYLVYFKSLAADNQMSISLTMVNFSDIGPSQALET